MALDERPRTSKRLRRAIRQAVTTAVAAGAALGFALVLTGFFSYTRSANAETSLPGSPFVLMFAGAGALIAIGLIATGVVMLFLDYDKISAGRVLGAGGGYLIGVPLAIVVIVAGLGWLW
jgi:hypothetical protein